MRASARWIFGILATAFVGWMVFDVGLGVGQGSAGVQLTDPVLRVNGVKIDRMTYETHLRNAYDYRRQQGAPVGESLEERRALEDAVVEDLIRSELLRQEFTRRGIRVREDEIVQMARTSPPPELMADPNFQTDGQFDIQKYLAFLSTLDRASLAALEDQYRAQIPQIKLFQRVTADIYVTDAKLWSMYRDQHDSVTFRLLEMRPEVAVPDSDVTATDAEVQSYFSAHLEDFRRPTTAYLSYITVSRRPEARDSAAALQRAESLKAELDAGADFGNLASVESADSVSAANDGDLGWVESGRFVPEFEAAARALRPGETSDPVQTAYGYHIIRLEGETADSIHVRHILIPIELAGDHLAEVESAADTMDLLAAGQMDPTALDEVAARLDLPVLTAAPLPEGSQAMTVNGPAPDAGIWAFEARVGEISDVVEAPDAYYLFRLDSLQEAHAPLLTDIEPAVRRAVLDEKKWQVARDRAATIGAALRSGQPLMDAALQNLLSARTLGPMTRASPVPAVGDLPEVVGAAFGLGVGQAAGPIETDDAIYFVETAAKALADSSAFVEQEDQQRAAVIQRMQQAQYERLILSLRSEAEVVDLRREIERQLRELEETSDNNPLGRFGT